MKTFVLNFIQVDLEFRKQWDKLVISLDVVDEDAESGAEVIHWVSHFPVCSYIMNWWFFTGLWSRDHDLGLETVSRPENHGLGLGLGLGTSGLGLGLGTSGLGLGLEKLVSTTALWSRFWSHDQRT